MKAGSAHAALSGIHDIVRTLTEDKGNVLAKVLTDQSVDDGVNDAVRVHESPGHDVDQYEGVTRGLPDLRF